MPKNNEPSHLETIDPVILSSMPGHLWRQNGPFLVCRSCVREHAQHVSAFGAGPTDIFIGLKDGKPTFKKLD